MGQLSIYARNSLLDHIFNNNIYTAPATVYAALATATITENDDGGTIAEANYTSYARVPIAFDPADLVSRSITQLGNSIFPKSTGGNITVTDYALLDSATVGTGNVLGFGKLLVPKNIVQDNTPTIRDDEVVISAGTTGGFTDYIIQQLLDFMFRNQPFSQPTLYVGLTTATIGNTDDGTTIVEATGANYARVDSPSFSDAAGASLSNDWEINFPVPGALGWGTVTSLFCSDTITAGAGNILFYDNDSVIDQVIAEDDIITIPTGYFTAELT